MQFATNLTRASDSEFEVVLFNEIRSVAHNTCYPQINRHTSVFSMGELESGHSEYAELEKKIFKAFEYFISGQNVTNDSDLLCCNEQFEAHLKTKLPKEKSTCGHIFQANEPTYCCRDCAVDSTCVLCRSCFFNGVHIKHKYKISSSSGSGYCDCGDPEAWVNGVWCSLHWHTTDDAGSTHEDTEFNKLTCSNDADTQLKMEMEQLIRHINCIPVDIVMRVGKLLKPLINSSIFCLTDLIQGTPCTTLSKLSSRYRGNLIDSSSSSDVSSPSETNTLDDIWITDDGVLTSPVDNDTVLDSWPPPYSHIPHVSPLEDVNSLQQDSWPRTAPKARSVADIKSRALAQLERARNYHPRLFPPHCMRTASDRTSASRAFVVVLHNNEYHNYEQVIKTLRRVLDCTVQQGTHHAVTVNHDGRTALQTNVTVDQASNIASVIMRTSFTLSSRPLYCTVEHADVYAMEIFFTLFLRWLRQYCEQVPSLRPVICHALLGFFPSIPGSNGVEADQTELTLSPLIVMPHSEMINDYSFINSVIERHTLTWRSVRQEILCIIMSVLLQHNFYRRVFAIKFTRVYGSLIQNLIYDDHLIPDNLCGLSCQLYTVISLARHLLENNSVLTRLVVNLERAFAANSIALPDFFIPNPQSNMDNQICVLHPSLRPDDILTNQCDVSSNDSQLSWVSPILELLKLNNPFEWGTSLPTSATSSALVSSVSPNNVSDAHLEMNIASKSNSSNPVPIEHRILYWQAGDTLGHSWFHPFERLFHCITDVNYVLASLTNVRPLAGDADSVDGWWTQAARCSYLDYIKHFLRLLSFIQDMNGMQRERQNHVSEELEWASGFYIMNHLISLLGLTVQVSSSDHKLYKMVLNEVIQIFEARVGILDRRFRVKPLADTQTVYSHLSFQIFGVTTEVYMYDVSVYRISLLQPLPRLLANFYAHGLEMGFDLESLGLTNKAFVNLLIERPLQIFSYCAQYNAKMWIRNGLAAQQSMSNLFSPPMRVELIDRDFQLLQLASCVLVPDEFLVRLIHKFQLGIYLENRTSRDSGQYRVNAMEMLLRLILICVANRFRPSIGNFTTEYYKQSLKNNVATGATITPTIPERIILDSNLEIYYSSLINDVIHTLCLRSLTYSELVSALPYQATNSLLLKYTKQVISSDEVNSEMSAKYDEAELHNFYSVASTIKPIQKASVSGRTNKLSLETVLPRILKQLAIQSTVSGRNVFRLKPEIMACRFNRFHWGYRHSEQTTAEANVSKALKKWLQENNTNNDPELVNYPIPPPPPKPLHKFQAVLYPGPLRLIQCDTFVRLLKTLLEIAVNSGNSAVHWSDTLLDLVLHLILVALYEDEYEISKSGNYPFLRAVDRVPDHMETETELEQLLCSRSWLKPTPSSSLNNVCNVSEVNCLTSRLMKLLQSSCHEDHLQLLRYTLNYWNLLIAQIKSHHFTDTNNQSPFVDSTVTSLPPLDAKKEARAGKARARRAVIMARMSNMQRNFMDSYAGSVGGLNEPEIMDVDTVDQTIEKQPIANTPFSVITALGPSRSLEFLSFKPTDLMNPSTLESVTCNLCLEEVPIDATPRHMVMGAHVCRSAVLATPAIGWFESPRGINIMDHLSDSTHPTAFDYAKSQNTIMEQIGVHSSRRQLSNSRWCSEGSSNIDLPCYFGSVACSTAAKCAECSRLGLCLFSELLHGIRNTGIIDSDICIADVVQFDTNKCVIGPGFIDQVLNNSISSEPHPQYTNNCTLDPWYPRPLIASRDPVIEEGSYLSFCSHPMHANCKTKYARQIKARVDHMNRNRTSSLIVYDFRCPLCKSISTIDIPLLSTIYKNTPNGWLKLRLLSRPDTVDTTAGFMTLSSWLQALRNWLNMSFIINDCEQHILDGSSSGMEETRKDDLSPTFYDYTLNNFTKIASNLGKLQSYDSSISQSDYSNFELWRQILKSVLRRLKSSLLLHDNSDDLPTADATCTSSSSITTTVQSKQATSTDKGLFGPIVNPLSRQFWTGRRFGRRVATLCGNGTKSGSNQVSTSNVSVTNNGLQNMRILPAPPDPPVVTTNLFTLVQRLSEVCRPRSVDSLVQRPIGRRTTSTEVSSTNADIVMGQVSELMDEEDEDEQILSFIYTDPELQPNVSGNNFPIIDYIASASDNPSSAFSAATPVTPLVPHNQPPSFSTSPNQQSTSRGVPPLLSVDTVVSLSESIERFHLDLMSLCERLRTLESVIPTILNIGSGSSSYTETAPSGSLQDNSFSSLNHNFVRLSLDRVNQRARSVIRSAAGEWRALRHSVAYTLVVSERNLRMNGPQVHFFNGGLADRHVYGLTRLLRISFIAHSQHAVVSRCCCKQNLCTSSSDTIDTGGDISSQIAESTTPDMLCRFQLINHPGQWWWWSYCVPFRFVASKTNDSFPTNCRLSSSSSILSLAESAVRVAASEDARFLWSLLLPPLQAKHGKHSSKSNNSNKCPFSYNFEDIVINTTCLTNQLSPTTVVQQKRQPSTSLLWEVDITFLFISLLHLRPGLENDALNDCQCTRFADSANHAAHIETSGPATLGSHLLACDQGHPRLPIGDCHETHLVRLCYTALLVQSLLSWQPNANCVDYLKRNNLISNDFELSLSVHIPSSWCSSQLLLVWRLLRDLSGLPSSALQNFDSISSTELALLSTSLGVFMRANTLPFLRIAAFVIQEITGINVPSDLSNQIATDCSDEYCLLLQYLNLPAGPNDLLVVLSTNQLGVTDFNAATSAASMTSEQHSVNDNTLSQLSESLWLARLITSWCLAGRSALSRQFYSAFVQRFPEQFGLLAQDSMRIMDLLPYPNVTLPHLIPLPKEYTTLLTLAVDLDRHSEGHTHSDLSICLVCGHLACLFCYSCHQFEQNQNATNKYNTTTATNGGNCSTGTNTNHGNEFVVYRMQVHSRRCHAGYSLLLRIHACRMLLLSDQARRLTEIPAPYRDSFGETDVDLRRGNPLYLDEAEYKRLNQAWLSHQFAANSSSELITPSNLLFGLY